MGCKSTLYQFGEEDEKMEGKGLMVRYSGDNKSHHHIFLPRRSLPSNIAWTFVNGQAFPEMQKCYAAEEVQWVAQIGYVHLPVATAGRLQMMLAPERPNTFAN